MSSPARLSHVRSDDFSYGVLIRIIIVVLLLSYLDQFIRDIITIHAYDVL